MFDAYPVPINRLHYYLLLDANSVISSGDVIASQIEQIARASLSDKPGGRTRDGKAVPHRCGDVAIARNNGNISRGLVVAVVRGERR